MITTILFVPGIIVYAMGQRERGEKILPNMADKAIAAVIVVLMAVSIASWPPDDTGAVAPTAPPARSRRRRIRAGRRRSLGYGSMTDVFRLAFSVLQ